VDNFSQCPKQVINANNAGVLNNIVSISAGKGFTLALSADGKVHAWGFNASGETGRGTTATPALSATPVQKASLQTDLSNVVAISAGYNFSLALTADGKVYAWGENNHGQIGQNVQYKLWSRAVPVMNPLGVGELSNIKMIAAGGGHALAMDKEANIVSWGYDPDGALGDGANRPAGNQWLIPHNVVNAAGIGLLSGAISISTGNANSLAVMPDGSLLIWGQGFGGANAQGINNTKNLAVPTPVKDMAGTGFLSLGPISTYQNWLHYGL
jgi:alpha-tubulin suppressor-like RCC1 family protein